MKLHFDIPGFLTDDHPQNEETKKRDKDQLGAAPLGFKYSIVTPGSSTLAHYHKRKMSKLQAQAAAWDERMT